MFEDRDIELSLHLNALTFDLASYSMFKDKLMEVYRRAFSQNLVF